MVYTLQLKKKKMVKRLIEHNKSTIQLDVNSMSNFQPEKWLLNSNIELEKAKQIEPSETQRSATLKLVNENLEDKALFELIYIAQYYENNNLLLQYLTKFSASLLINELLYHNQKIPDEMIRSLYLSSIYSGYSTY